MDWKPVKSKGARSPQGQRHARELDRIKAPFIKRRNGDGSVSRKKDGALFERSLAKDDPPLPDGFYSLGWGGTEYRIMGSRTAKGKFEDRGSAGASSFAVANIQFYGRGRGADTEVAFSVESVKNFDNITLPCDRVTLGTTRDGKKMTARHASLTTNVRSGRLHRGSSFRYFGWAGTVLKDGKHVPRVYFVGLQIIDGQHLPKLYADPTEKLGNVEDLPCPFVSGHLCAEPSVHVVDTSGKVMLMNRYMRPTYSPSTASPVTCPGITFTTSSNHGASWADIPTPSMFTDADSLAFLPYGTPGLALNYNDAVNGAALELFCADPDTSSGVAMGVVPCALFIGGVWVVRYRAKVGRYSGFSISASFTIGEHANASAARNMMSSAVPLVRNGVQGILYFDRSDPDTSLIPATNPRLYWTDGLTTTFLGTVPFPSRSVGYMAGIGPGKIVCPMHDGGFSLYELTSDMTWAKRATINATAPRGSLASWTLQEFSSLTYLRKDGVPVSATPSAPWMTDSRKKPPE